MAEKTGLTVEQRVDVQMALSNYLRSLAEFERASTQFNEACQSVRKHIPKQSRFMIREDYKYYLVTADQDGSFEVEPLDLI
jgi:hypothetical protein